LECSTLVGYSPNRSHKTRLERLARDKQSRDLYYKTEGCFTQAVSGLTHKLYTRLERLARDKHSSLLRKSVNLSYSCLSSTVKCLQIKPGAYLRVEFLKDALLDRLCLYLKTLDKAEKVAKDKYSSLLRKFVNYEHKTNII
jgi:hypothetical protein